MRADRPELARCADPISHSCETLTVAEFGLVANCSQPALFVCLPHYGASAQTADQLVKGATDTANVLNYGMGYNLQRFSPLTQINRDNAKNLVPVWNYSFADDRSEESQPLVYQGVVYVTTHAATMAQWVRRSWGQSEIQA